MNTPLENQIKQAFPGGIGELENLQITYGESDEKFWPTCMILVSTDMLKIGTVVNQWMTEHPGEKMIPNYLLTYVSDNGQSVEWEQFQELAEAIKRKCQEILSNNSKKN